MKKISKPLPPLSEELKKNIVDRWRYYPLNSIPQLAAEFDCSQAQINKVVNNYLSSKIRS